MPYIDNINHNFDNPITKPIIDALEIEENILKEGIEDVRNQFFIDSATYGLDKWENMLGITRNNFNYDIRRENIKAKIRARGTTTIDCIKNICEAYTNGTVNIVVNHNDYSFVIDLVGTLGVPLALAEMDKVVEAIKPAHLAYSYKFNYNSNKDLSKFTHKELSENTHKHIRDSEEFRGDMVWLEDISKKKV